MTAKSRLGALQAVAALSVACAIITNSKPASAVSLDPASINLAPINVDISSSLICGSFGDEVNCGSFQPISPFQPYVGQTVSETFNFKSPLIVPGSSIINGVYTTLYTSSSIFELPNPGPNGFTSTLSFTGYSPPSDMFGVTTPLSYYYANVYDSEAGFYPGNGGFSVSSITTNGEINSTDSNYIVGVGVGYFYLLNSPPQTIQEIGSGTPSNPIILDESEVGQLTASLPSGDSTAFYKFASGGGLFQVSGSVGAPSGSNYTFELLSSNGTVEQTVTLNSEDNYAAVISDTLAPGDYVIGVKGTASADPELTLTFDTPVAGVSAAPEPAAWALMLMGVGLTGGILRRRSKANRAPSRVGAIV